MATPTPSSLRHRSRQPSSTQRQSQRPRASTPPLPPYEAPITPLHNAAQAKLISLIQSHSLRPLKTHLQHAEEKLTDSAGEVNDRLTEARVRLQRLKERRENRENPNEDDEDAAQQQEDDNDRDENLRELEERVVAVTEKLEAQMRGTIDGEVRVDGLAGVLGKFEKEVERDSSFGRSIRRRTRRRDGDREEDDDDEEEDEDYVEAEERGGGSAPPTSKLDELLGENYAEWDRLSLTQRYSTNNAYIGFYRIIHEAKQPGEDIAPLPHASTWFSHLEDPTAASGQAPDSSGRRTRRRRSPSPADSDEIAIESERISLKCPLTLLYFRDPVTSTKCPHSFEREAIEDMITHSSTTVPAPQAAAEAAGRSARRVRSVKCPVCSVVLTAADLRPDPVLVRRLRRYEAALEREAEEDELSDGERRRRSGARKSGITLVDDDGAGDDNKMDVDVDQDEEEDEDDRQDGESFSSQDHVRIKQEMGTAPVDDD